MSAPECDACLRNALWRIHPACSCVLPPRGGTDRHWYYACTHHIGMVTRLFTEGHRRHVGQTASEVVMSEVPK
ncbi:hypothetical protein [Salinispora pacifica]|uniref:hypothetical protein n=1 Tax=Salinispora pacifica TaxID=351187 RepID=UPI0004B96694|nr:hypothetical protein [Salinispora pacifica]